MSSVGADFRLLTPLVLTEALRHAGTVVHEPVHRFRLDAPAASTNAVLKLLAGLDAVPEPPEAHGTWIVVRGVISVARLPALRQRLSGATAGDGTVESGFDRYRPVPWGLPPQRHRPEPDPRFRVNYLRQVVLH